MQTELINLLLAFIEGLGLIISPCILPILPIILSGSLAGSRSRPYGIIIGFVLVFSIVTLFARKLVNATGIDFNLIRHVSYGLLILFGLTMLSSYLSECFTFWTRRLTNVGQRYATVNDTQGGFGSGILFGGLVGIIWTPCAGPILAAVIVQTVLQRTDAWGYVIALAFALGAAVPMLIIALFGRQLLQHTRWLTPHTSWIRKALGVIIILTVGYMIKNEGVANVNAEPITITQPTQNTLIGGLVNPYPAPAIAGIDAWLNSPPLTAMQLQGKVVLIDFWTYSCINCVRTIPYLRDWYQKYHDKGLVIIGVHAPEFEFEKNIDNVKNAIAKLNIPYPVALDNHFVTWQNYQNHYWPAHYLIDKKGMVVYQHFGEGEYDVTENNIRYLLGLNRAETKLNIPTFSGDITPETYLGYARMARFAGSESVQEDRAAEYHYPASLPQDAWGLNGRWTIDSDRIIAGASNSTIKIHVHAAKVYAVMGTNNNQPIHVRVISDIQSNPVQHEIIVNKHDLYELLNSTDMMDGDLELISLSSGLEIYTFTFGS